MTLIMKLVKIICILKRSCLTKILVSIFRTMMPSDVRNLLDTTAADNYAKDVSFGIFFNI